MMKFHTGKQPFRGMTPLAFDARNESDDLTRQWVDHNKANRGKGLKYLRSFLSRIAVTPGWECAKTVYAAVNSADPSSAIPIARTLLSQSYDSAEEHFRAVQVGAFVKKYPFASSSDKRQAEALKKFLRGERRNRHMNALLRRRRIETGHMGVGEPSLALDPNPICGRIRTHVRKILGEKPPMKDIMNECVWGPGAVVGVNGRFTNFARKLLAEEWTVTPAAIPYALTALKRFPMFWELLGLTRSYQVDGNVQKYYCVDSEEFDRRAVARMKIVQFNKIAFVQKDADCDRTIASEPSLNQFVQLGVDAVMKRKLKRIGIDLTNQYRNQVMARLGSVMGWLNPYCTADLRNASGSIFTELVRELSPPAWFKLFNDLRSPSYMLGDGDPIKYQGFVSMGNGFCFPLETVIFASICLAAHEYCGTTPDFRVYGDDIIVRRNESGVVQEYLRYFGFELNPDKSFFFGPFRESCGADWYDGEPVRPVYFDDSLELLEQRVRMHNSLARVNNVWAEPLAHACRNWFPTWISKFARPFSDEQDEALDNRWSTVQREELWCKTYNTPAWYGILFKACPDKEVRQHPDYGVAMKYGVLSGSDARQPFAERRETSMLVRRFTHGGGSNLPLPHEEGHREMTLRPRFSIRVLYGCLAIEPQTCSFGPRAPKSQ